jgi:hypothetical protein
MRIGLIAAIRCGADGALRASLPLAGRSVLAWQASLLTSLGTERVLCLTDSSGANADIIAVQQAIEAEGQQFHALKGFAALPALVRAEDELIVVLDGLVPDPGLVRAVLGAGGTNGSGVKRVVATLPADHPLAASHPEDFERIDAARHWAGVLAMRGAAVQHLADFPDDADATSLLLRLALQAGTPCTQLAARELVPESWMLADSPAAVARHGTALIASAASPTDWYAPGLTLASTLVRALVPRGFGQGAPVVGGTGFTLLLAAVLIAAFGPAAGGLGLAVIGAFLVQVAQAFATLGARLRGEVTDGSSIRAVGVAVDVLASAASWFALVPWPQWQPLGVLGPVVIALARLVARAPGTRLGAAASDRVCLLLLLTLSAFFGLLPETLACLSLGLLAALLLRSGPD